jgi:hypothetical protein
LDRVVRSVGSERRGARSFEGSSWNPTHLEPATSLYDGGDLEGERCFRRALVDARDQGARSLELRAAVSLARLGQRRGKPAAARDVLAPVHERLTEALETGDSREARALLDALAAS